MVVKRISVLLMAVGSFMPLAPAAMAEQSYLALYTGYTVTDSPDLYTLSWRYPA